SDERARDAPHDLSDITHRDRPEADGERPAPRHRIVVVPRQPRVDRQRIRKREADQRRAADEIGARGRAHVAPPTARYDAVSSPTIAPNHADAHAIADSPR